jgi:methyl-accepting chemotaxis protein
VSQGERSNLATEGGGTSTARSSAPQKKHIYDQISFWITWVSFVGLVGTVYVGWGTMRTVLLGERWWLVIGPAFFLSIFMSAFGFRYFVSFVIGLELRKLAQVAEAVAAGDLTKHAEAAKAGGDMGRLGRAFEAMTAALTKLATHIRSATHDTNAYANEITGGTEHLAQAASAIAETASSLSHQAVQMADTIGLLSADTSRLSELARGLATGARQGLDRNRRLMTLASDNHERLDETGGRLGLLAQDVQASAHALEELGTASDEIRAFVTLVQKIARQSKLLALNAAMEAARAGEQGEGFTVVANEVRRLAATSSEAAEQTEALIQGILGRLEEARGASARALDRVGAVREATEHGRQSFTQVETAVGEADQWTSAMVQSAAAGDQLVDDLRNRLNALNDGTQSFVNAIHDVAAASQEQSASTEEIAAAATQLSVTALQLELAAKAFRAADAR